MFVGMITFVCNDCGRKFEGAGIVWMATRCPVPQKCPGCGSYHTMPDGFLGFRKKWCIGSFGSWLTEFTKSINSNS